jgi:hypothetical protein
MEEERMALRPVASRGAPPLALSAALAWSILLPGGSVEAVEFDHADIFYELNATDGDVGVQVSLDAESWRVVRIASPRGQQIFEVEPKGALRRIGLTELFFEGEEPSLKEVPFSRFRALFPEGRYVFSGRTTDGRALRSTDPLTAELPCPVRVVSPKEDEPVSPDKIVIRWRAAPGVYDPDTGRCDTRRNVGLVGYQVIVVLENEDRGLLRELLIDVPPGVTALPIPEAFVAAGARLSGTEFTLEVLAIENSGNKTITEQGLEVE